MSILDTAKTVYDLAKKGATVELQEQLMKMREEALELQEENLDLRQKSSDFEKAQELNANLQFDGTVYWRTDLNQDQDGPFCQRCYDTETILVRLQDGTFFDGDRNVKLWDCKACKATYQP